MTDSFEFTLDNPLTEEQWDMIADVDFDHTDRIWFHTKHGKEVEFAKVVRCKECKYFKKHTGKYLEQRFRKDGICRYHNYEETTAEEFCSKGIKDVRTD